MKSDRWLPMCSCVWRVCHLIYTSHPAFSWLFILFEATLHTPRKHSYTRRLIPFPPQDASLFWMTWMDVVLSASQRNGIFFRSTSGIWSQGHISDLSLEFLHFSNLKSLYARKTDHSVPIFQLPCIKVEPCNWFLPMECGCKWHTSFPGRNLNILHELLPPPARWVTPGWPL